MAIKSIRHGCFQTNLVLLYVIINKEGIKVYKHSIKQLVLNIITYWMFARVLQGDKRNRNAILFP